MQKIKDKSKKIKVRHLQTTSNILFCKVDFKVVFSHVSNSIKANFNGTGISASLAALSTGASITSYFYVIVDGNLIKFYHLINMNDAATGTNLWNFSNYSPDAVVINASSNDYSSGSKSSKMFLVD